jgi:hypothetical protein
MSQCGKNTAKTNHAPAKAEKATHLLDQVCQKE